MSAPPTLADIEQAARQIAGAVIRTPFLPAPRLSSLTGAEVWVKYENLQATSSFKERGALVKLLSLGESDRQRGVIAMSAGNHAQAVAYHAQRLGIPAMIVMPRPTPFVKVGATRAFGAKVILDGETLADCEPTVGRIVADTGAILVHPYDDPLVIRGQGTIGLEVLADKPDLDALIVPVGGGGLISGIAIAAKALRPDLEVIGVETELYPSVWGALRGEKAKLGGETLAEGIAVKNVGRLTLPIIRELVDHVVLVGEADIERAVAEYVLLQKTMAEGAGAVGLAAMIADRSRFAGRRVGLVLAGGNIDPRLAASIMVRELAREDRVVAIRVFIDDRPGVLGSIARTIGSEGGNIIEVSHKRNVLSVPPKGALVEITMETFGSAHAAAIINALSAAGYRVERLDPPPPLPA
ncbi:MAG TPA: threonine ammonia-lyase [Bauldia sp.]|nr:threonine ammonia-lyase [Bauldia sp.]